MQLPRFIARSPNRISAKGEHVVRNLLLMSMMPEAATTTEKPFGTSTGTSLPLSKDRAHVRHARNGRGYMPVCPGTGGSEKERHSLVRHAIAPSPTAINANRYRTTNERDRPLILAIAGSLPICRSVIHDQLNKAQIPRCCLIHCAASETRIAA